MNGALQRALAGESQASPEAGAKGHAPKEPRRRFAAVLWVYTQSTTLVTTTRTEGARVVLTLPVARKRLRGGAGLGGAQPGSWRFRTPLSDRKPALQLKRSREVRTVVGLLAALASAAENFARFSAASGTIDIRRRDPARKQPYRIACMRSLVVRATWRVEPSCALPIRLTANGMDRVNAMLFARNARVALKAMMGFQGVC